MTKIQLSKETERYLANGLEVLKKAGKKGKYYEDGKYVKMAGHTLYSAMLLALDDVLQKTRKNRNTESEYRKFLAGKNKSILKDFNNAYFILHQSMGYDGVLSNIVIQDGIKTAKNVINWVIKQKNQN